VNYVLSSLPTFYMCSIKVPIDILNQVDKYRRHYLWAFGDINANKNPHWLLGNWLLGQKSKGGLGVIKLRIQNEVLLIKNLDKFFSKADLPWVKLIWDKYYSNGSLFGNRMK
jgi:hypothetical protein